MLSNACQYGLRAMIHLATQDDDGYVPVRDISSILDVSPTFLAKVVRSLTSAGLLRSLRGPTGGVRLARKAKDIRMAEVIEAIDGPEVFLRCVLGLPDCGDAMPCPMHYAWGHVRDSFRDMLSDTSLYEFAEQTRRDGLRLSAGMPRIEN